jgi:hypothetical protein
MTEGVTPYKKENPKDIKPKLQSIPDFSNTDQQTDGQIPKLNVPPPKKELSLQQPEIKPLPIIHDTTLTQPERPKHTLRPQTQKTRKHFPREPRPTVPTDTKIITKQSSKIESTILKQPEIPPQKKYPIKNTTKLTQTKTSEHNLPQSTKPTQNIPKNNKTPIEKEPPPIEIKTTKELIKKFEETLLNILQIDTNQLTTRSILKVEQELLDTFDNYDQLSTNQIIEFQKKLKDRETERKKENKPIFLREDKKVLPITMEERKLLLRDIKSIIKSLPPEKIRQLGDNPDENIREILKDLLSTENRANLPKSIRSLIATKDLMTKKNKMMSLLNKKTRTEINEFIDKNSDIHLENVDKIPPLPPQPPPKPQKLPT